MDKTYNLNELALMTGFTTRTLRNYLSQGILKGSKADGTWRFTLEEIDRFFSEPFVKEGLRIKRNSIVFDFLADRAKKKAKTCVILDLPVPITKGNEISAFFCEQMQEAQDALFNFEGNLGRSRVILSGAAEEVERIMKAFYERNF